MRDLDLDDLPRWSPWPARLLRLDAFPEQNRTLEKIEQEYNQEKFKDCLENFKASGGDADPVALRFSISRTPLDEESDAVWQGRLVVASQNEMIDRLFDLLGAAIAPVAGEGRSVVELGSAFGTNLWVLAKHLPAQQFIGGDYSDNAIDLAAKLYAECPHIRVGKLNFYDEVYPALEEAEGPVTVFTSQAIEQLPSAAAVVKTLGRYRDKIHRVFHLEPAYELHDESLLGLLRRRYATINDYNLDLLHQLRAPGHGIDILDVQKDVIGFNAFNPLSLVTWAFKKN